MNKQVINLIERNADKELKAYFEDMSHETPLDCHEEKVLLEHFPIAAVESYINRFRFSEEAEKLFMDKAPSSTRLRYINYYGLRPTTQRYILEKNMVEAIKDFSRMRHFEDVDFLLEQGSDEAVRIYLANNRLEKDEQVLKVLHRKNPTLFREYVNKQVISENVKKVIVEEDDYDAFRAVVSKFYRLFRTKSRKAKDFKALMESKLAAEAISSDLQVEILQSHNRDFIMLLLQNCPLSAEAQEVLWKYNYDAEWLKFHVVHLYCMGGYRFTPANEEKLFKTLASKNLDDCLTQFRQQDDVSFVKFASINAVKKYIKNFWLTDEAQVALVDRGEGSLLKEFVSRFSPEHGMCWQAEVELVKLGAWDIIKEYISFHSMCWEALSAIKENKPELAEEYYSKHPY